MQQSVDDPGLLSLWFLFLLTICLDSINWYISNRKFNAICQCNNRVYVHLNSRCLSILGSPKFSLIVPPLPGSHPLPPPSQGTEEEGDPKTKVPQQWRQHHVCVGTRVFRFLCPPHSVRQSASPSNPLRQWRSHSAWLSPAMHFRTFPGAGADLFENRFTFFWTLVFDDAYWNRRARYRLTDCRDDSL